jgi:hypothetical protein
MNININAPTISVQSPFLTILYTNVCEVTEQGEDEPDRSVLAYVSSHTEEQVNTLQWEKVKLGMGFTPVESSSSHHGWYSVNCCRAPSLEFPSPTYTT